MYEVKLKDGGLLHSPANNYKKLMEELVRKGITPKKIKKIWTIVPMDVDYYNKVEREVGLEEG